MACETPAPIHRSASTLALQDTKSSPSKKKSYVRLQQRFVDALRDVKYFVDIEKDYDAGLERLIAAKKLVTFAHESVEMQWRMVVSKCEIIFISKVLRTFFAIFYDTRKITFNGKTHMKYLVARLSGHKHRTPQITYDTIKAATFQTAISLPTEPEKYALKDDALACKSIMCFARDDMPKTEHALQQLLAGKYYEFAQRALAILRPISSLS